MSRLPRRLLPGLAATVAVAALTLTATPADAAVSGKQRVAGYTKSECETKGGKVARKKQNEGYIVTFVGCAYDGLANKPWNGTVFWHS